MCCFVFSSRRRHTRCELVTGVQTCALPIWQGYAGRNSHVFTLVNTAPDLDRAKADRKVAVIMGLQNSEHFRTKDDVKAFYQLGQRCSQLTYNRSEERREGKGRVSKCRTRWAPDV